MKGCIIYCSSNQERQDFEQKIRDNILASCGDIPIISVTQKPIKFGVNICVGDDIGISGFNYFRQFLMGAEASNADYVISAEADCLYPPDYFQFVPESLETCYRNRNLYVMGNKRDYYWHKPEGATHSQVVGREFYVQRLRMLFHGAPQWSEKERNFPRERWGQVDVVKPEQLEYWDTENPVVQIKTGQGMRHYTRSERVDILEIPYWKSGKELKRRICG